MTRKPNPHRDRNKERAYVWGRAARLNGKPESSCPNLIPLYGEEYAIQLMDAWMRGWHEADKEQNMQTRKAMKGAD